jgi:hypothetical protein
MPVVQLLVLSLQPPTSIQLLLLPLLPTPLLLLTLFADNVHILVLIRNRAELPAGDWI